MRLFVRQALKLQLKTPRTKILKIEFAGLRQAWRNTKIRLAAVETCIASASTYSICWCKIQDKKDKRVVGWMVEVQILSPEASCESTFGRRLLVSPWCPAASGSFGSRLR